MYDPLIGRRTFTGRSCALIAGAATGFVATRLADSNDATGELPALLQAVESRFELKCDSLISPRTIASDLAHVAYAGTRQTAMRAARALSESAVVSRPERRAWLDRNKWRVATLDGTDRFGNGEAHPGEIGCYMAVARYGPELLEIVDWIPWKRVVLDACNQLNEGRPDCGHALLAALELGLVVEAALVERCSSLAAAMRSEAKLPRPCWGFHEIRALLAASTRIPECSVQCRTAAFFSLERLLDNASTGRTLWPEGFDPEGRRAFSFLGHLMETIAIVHATHNGKRFVSNQELCRGASECWRLFELEAEYIGAGPLTHFLGGLRALNSLRTG